MFSIFTFLVVAHIIEQKRNDSTLVGIQRITETNHVLDAHID